MNPSHIQLQLLIREPHPEMTRWITLSNAMDTTKNMRMEYRGAFLNCSCTSDIRDELCNAHTVELDYAPLCKALDFDPEKKLFFGEAKENIPIVGPVDPLSAKPFDNCVPVVRVPVHKCTGSTIVLTQTGPLPEQ
jgi:hypothetical protein